MYLYFGTGTCAVPTAEAVSTGDINGSNCTGRLRSIPSFTEMIVQTCENTLNGKRGFNNRLQYQIRFISLKVAFHNDL